MVNDVRSLGRMVAAERKPSLCRVECTFRDPEGGSEGRGIWVVVVLVVEEA